MGFLRISFGAANRVDEHRKLLQSLEFVRIVGDHHVILFASASAVGLSFESAPVRSIERDRNRGVAFAIECKLQSDEILSGQLRRSGLLLCGKHIAPLRISSDRNVQQLIAAFVAMGNNPEIEIA